MQDNKYLSRARPVTPYVSPIFERMSPIFSPHTTFSGDFKREQNILEFEEKIFQVNFEIQCNQDKMHRLIDLTCVSKEDCNKEIFDELDVCNRSFSSLYEKKLKLHESLMHERKITNTKKIEMAKRVCACKDVEEKREEEKEESDTSSWKDFDILKKKEKRQKVEIIWERALEIQKLPEKIHTFLQRMKCGDYLSNKGDLMRALKLFNKRFEIKQKKILKKEDRISMREGKISKSEGLTTVYECCKGQKQELLVIHSEASTKDLKYSIRKCAYWILKNFGEDLEQAWSRP